MIEIASIINAIKSAVKYGLENLNTVQDVFSWALIITI